MRAISIHAPRTGSDSTCTQKGQPFQFQSTLPARGATVSNPQPSTGCINFNPRSPHGERPANITDVDFSLLFQSTLPARGATLFRALQRAHIVISIHAPRTGSDAIGRASRRACGYFNPRSPHGERHGRVNRIALKVEFQSTLPARGATRRGRGHGGAHPHFNPRSPHGERLTLQQATIRRYEISIHAPRTGSDREGTPAG